MANEVTILVSAKDAATSVFGAVQRNAKQMSAGVDASMKVAATAVLGVAAAGATAAAGAYTMASKYAAAGSEIHDFAQRTNLGTVTLSELKYAADQSGTSIDGLAVGVGRMERTVFNARNGLQGAVDTLDELGVSVDELSGKSPDEIFDTMVAHLADVKDGANQAALAQQLFGKSGAQLLPMLDGGAAGLAKLRAEAHDLGIVFSQEDANAADEFGDAQLRMERRLEGVSNTIARQLLPVLGPMVDKFGEWIDQHGDEFAKDVGKAIDGVATTAGSLFETLDKIAKLGAMKVVVDVLAQKQGEDIVWTLLATTLGGKIAGPQGAAIGFGASQAADFLSSGPEHMTRDLSPSGFLNNLRAFLGGRGFESRSATQRAVELHDAATNPAAAAENAAILAWQNAMLKANQTVADGADNSADNIKKSTDKASDALAQLAERIAGEHTSAIVDAFLKGGDGAVAAVRDEQDALDKQWAGIAAQMHDNLGIAVPDEFRLMWEGIIDTQKQAAKDLLKEEAKLQADRLATVRAGSVDYFRMLTAGGNLSTAAAQQAAFLSIQAAQGDATRAANEKLLSDWAAKTGVPNVTVNVNGIITDPVATGQAVAQALNAAAIATGPVVAAGAVQS